MKRLAPTLLMYFLVAPLACGQSARGAETIVGRVSPAVRLSLGQGRLQSSSSSPDGLQLVASADRVDSVLVTVSGTGGGAPAQLALPLEIRTNVGYELRITLISSEGCAPNINASINSIRPTGPWVSQGAAAVSLNIPSIDLMSCRNPVVALRGPRVSTGGNFTSPGNALAADLNLTISDSVNCSWRVLFRVSLHRSS